MQVEKKENIYYFNMTQKSRRRSPEPTKLEINLPQKNRCMTG